MPGAAMQSNLSNEAKSPRADPSVDHSHTADMKACALEDEPEVNVDKDRILDANKAEIDDDEDLPIDKGWAWAVLAGAILYLMVMGGLKKNFGLFFVAYQTRFHADASTTSLLTTVQAAVASVTSLLNMTIGMHYMSHRTSIAIGTLLISAAYISNAFAPNIHVLMVNFIFDGIGGAMIHSPVLAILVEYFKNKRGFANGLAFSGGSLGNFIFAPLYTFLFDYYGYTGTLLIVTGVLLNISVSAALFRPLSSFKTKVLQNVQQNGKVNNHDEGIQVGDKQFHPVIYSKEVELQRLSPFPGVVNGHANSYIDISRQGVLQTQKGGLSPLLPRARAWSTGSKQQRSVGREQAHIVQKPLTYIVQHLSRSEVALYGNEMADIVGSSFNMEYNRPKKKSNSVEKFYKFMKKTLVLVFDTSLLKNKVFLLCLLMSAMFAPSTGFMIIFLVPHAKDQGIPSSERGILLSVLGLVGLFTRLSMAMLVDKKFVKLTTILGTAALINGTMVHFTRFFTSYQSLIGFSVILGLTCDIYQAMYSVVLVEYLTLPKVKSALGFTIMCQAVSVAVSFPLVGWLRDATGSYLASYHLLGSMAYVGAMASFLIPLAYKKI